MRPPINPITPFLILFWGGLYALVRLLISVVEMATQNHASIRSQTNIRGSKPRNN